MKQPLDTLRAPGNMTLCSKPNCRVRPAHRYIQRCVGRTLRPFFILLGALNRYPRLMLPVALLLVAGCASSGPLRPFTTDGCSDFPEGTSRDRTLWLDCCTAHDKAYWLGGTYAERAAADKELRRCVAAVGEPAIASLMLAGVRVGGSPFWPTRFRWGYGWPWPRGYRALTPEERAQAEQLLQTYEQEHDHRER